MNSKHAVAGSLNLLVELNWDRALFVGAIAASLGAASAMATIAL